MSTSRTIEKEPNRGGADWQTASQTECVLAGRLPVTNLRTTSPVRIHEMRLYRRYFDLVFQGKKTLEIRVDDSKRREIEEGSLIRFCCDDDEAFTRVTRVSRYRSFEEMFDREPVSAINPLANREEQLADICKIYPPDREALGVIAIGIELIDPPRPA